MGSLPQRLISQIAIIGAGPSGISAAKSLRAEKAFETIDIFEQRHDVGGVWNRTSNLLSQRIPIPQLDPNYVVEQRPSHQLADETDETDGDSSQIEPLDRFETPLYDLLETNIPKVLMQYANRPFDEDLPLFPRHESVLRYCREYAKDVRSLIRFGCQVVEVHPIPEGLQDHTSRSRWSVTIVDGVNQTQVVREYDAIVVASGHFSVPHIPAIQGIEAWSSAYEGSIIHSKAYRNPAMFAGKKVIVVGNSASGIDIGAQIGKFCKQPLLQSSRTESIFSSPGRAPWKEDIPQIVEFLDPKQRNRSVRLMDGRIEQDIDAVVFATGYFYSFPFLKINPPIITDGLRARDVYQQLFHIKYPTLAFPVLPQRVVPFPIAENQAAVIARVWSGRLTLPSETEMRAWEKERLEDRGDGKAMHILNFPVDADYQNMLYEWASAATPCEGLESDGIGLMGTRCDGRRRWMRSQIPAMKMAYANRGEKRLSVRTVEELGFDYEMWKKTQEESEEGSPTELVKSISSG